MRVRENTAGRCQRGRWGPGWVGEGKEIRQDDRRGDILDNIVTGMVLELFTCPFLSFVKSVETDKGGE